MASSSVALWSVIAITFQLIRLSVELVRIVTSQANAKQKELDEKDKSSSSSKSGEKGTKDDDKATTTTPLAKSATNYGSVKNDEESKPFLDEENPASSSPGSGNNNSMFNLSVPVRFQLFLGGWLVVALVFVSTLVYAHYFGGKQQTLDLVYPNSLLAATMIILAVEMWCLCLDTERLHYGAFQRIIRLAAMLILWVTYTTQFLMATGTSGKSLAKRITSGGVVNLVLWVDVTVGVLWAVADGWLANAHPTPKRRQSLTEAAAKPTLSSDALLKLVKPYFWPDATSETAFWNRVRAIGTWLCVISSKACNLVTPLLLGKASTALAHQDYAATIRLSILYAVITWLGSAFKECQSLVYLKVAQAAFVQLSEASFEHLHSLSLDWHLRKKLGEVLRSLDRGTGAMDTLMKYLFLWLGPALAECLLVTIIFATYFQYFPLAAAVFYFVFAYVVWTILLTLWRKQFRKALVKSDNEWHDLFTDSMVNFETVKYFTAEKYEKERFRDAVDRYQVGSVHVQGSLAALNMSQQVILQACMATALSLAALGIERRISCCIETIGCESGISDCCRSVPSDTCPGMEVGDFVAVLSYIGNLFAPLFFLGSVYNAVVMAIIDLTNLSELLAEDPDVVDAPDAFELPRSNASEPDVAVEFDNVHFHYPTQPDDKGLQGLSFKMKRGTTTAIVGPTGAGKTTVSRLLFRFYDVLGGAVKINGVDVRSVTQKSLRGSMGVVPQAASMFNDTIRANLLYGRRDATEEELIQAAKDAQLLGFIESLDDKWESMVGDRGLKLSGGEKQRAAIARCLLKDPPFVLLDEATSALDTLTESSVQEALDRLGAERTVLVIAHRLGTIRNADNIVVLKDGKVAEEGTHDALLARNGVYADMWNMQLHSTSASASQVDLSAAASS